MNIPVPTHSTHSTHSTPQVQKVSKAWHERVVDLEIERPDLSLGEIAKMLGVSQSHLSRLRNSDAFIEYRALRFREHQEHISRGIAAQQQGLVKLGLDVLKERIENERDEIGLGIVKDTTEMVLKSMGYGPSPVAVNIDQSRNTQNNVFKISPEERESYDRAREKLQTVTRLNTKEVEDAEVVEDGEDGEGVKNEHENRSSESGLLESSEENKETEELTSDRRLDQKVMVR